jgi:adenine-specific DNA-methyltransferase
MVDRILAAKLRNYVADTRAPKTEIDRLVYALYGLTEEETRIVEGRES